MAKKKTSSSARSTQRSSRTGEKSAKTQAKKTPTRKKTTRKATTKKAAMQAQTNGEDSSPKRKTHLSDKELEHYRKQLIARGAEVLGDMLSMSEEALHTDDADLSHMPIHMADVGSDNYEQELMLGLVESEYRLVKEINDALQRIMERTYGVCEETGKPISKARLNAKPWAKLCIEAAREAERNGGGQR